MNKFDDRQHATIFDLVRCPGLYAGQYDDIEALPREFVEYRSSRVEAMLGIPRAWPTDKARDYVDENN